MAAPVLASFIRTDVILVITHKKTEGYNPSAQLLSLDNTKNIPIPVVHIL
jgi:hypothetical protein